MLTRADEVTRALGVDTTATATVVRLCEVDEGDELVLEWSNAGHPPPLVLHDDGRVETLSAEQTDLLLGIDPSTHRQLQTAALPDAATLLLYTDGLVERRDQPLPVGIARLQEVAGAARCGADLEGLLEVLLAKMLPPSPSDDAALVAVRRR
jgi:serine phosphatase RsbU (regulator of sigma subunit)